jgi:GNAT superfamily N-acetyltransferase
MTVTIRDATAADGTVWQALWAEYLAFYKTTLAPEITASTWARCLAPDSRLTLRLAEVDGTVQGFALHHWHESTWAIGPDCYLEDLFVSAGARGTGIGRALIDDLIAICRVQGHSRLYWMTDEGNARARSLYDSYTPTDGHLRYRITF